MKTVIVGGGKGCRAILGLLAAGHLRELGLDVVCVVDPRPQAPGVEFAREQGIPVLTDYMKAIDLPDTELFLELTGNPDILADIYHKLPYGARVLDHASARIFWDMFTLERNLRQELKTRAELEEELAEDRRRAQHVLDSVPDIVVVLDPDRRIQQANARIADICGLGPEEVVGRDCRELLCSAPQTEGFGGSRCALDEAVALQRPVATVIERHQPQHAFYEVTAIPRYDAAGKLIEVVETHHPITKRIALQREAETSERRFRQFIHSAHDIISMKDAEGRYLVVNPATAALFHRDPLEFIGKTAEELYEPEVAQVIVEHDRTVMQKKEWGTYLESLVIDGREIHLETTRFPLFNYRGEVEGVCTIARDVTEKRNLQNQLLQSAKLAAVGKLAAGVAHEINNPLTGVLAYAEDLLEETPAGDERRLDYEVIIRETLRCRDIVRNLLDFARQEEPNFQAVDLNEVVERSLTLVERLPRFRDIALRRKLSDQPLPVPADARQLQQIVLNLVINANEAMGGKGEIAILSGRLPGSGRCYVSVQDSGPGVAPEVREKIFEPFFSTKSTSGLGLAVSWGIAERHGGVIEVGESPFGGADFRVVLPPAAEDT